jgi:predicted TIM-barrel fold metal-dependent hydrolase
MQNKWALEEHLSTAENNTLWDSAGESARNGKALTEYVEIHLLDVDERIALMDKTGIERAILSLTSPGVQSILDTKTAIRVARDTNDAVRASLYGQGPRLAVDVRVPAHAGRRRGGR